MIYSKVGAFLQLYHNNWKPDFTLNSFRKFYSDSPIYLVSDGGDNFSEISNKYNCNYEHSDFNTGIRGGFNLKEMMIWINRFRCWPI